MKKNNKLTNKSSSSAINTSSYYSVDKNSYKSLTKHRNTKNHNKHVIVVNQNNNLAVLSGKKVENNLNDNDVESKFNSILEENEELKNRNIILEKKNKDLSNLINSNNNSSGYNIRVDKPTRIIMDHSLVLNDLSLDKFFQVNNNNSSMSATNMNKKEFNASFCAMKVNHLFNLKNNVSIF